MTKINPLAPRPGFMRPEGPLTDAEIEGLRRAYAAGARGQLLIGLRQQERVLTMMLPARGSIEAAAALLRQNAEQLHRLGADGFVHARRVRLRKPRTRARACLLIHECIEHQEQCRVVFISGSQTLGLRSPVADDAAMTIKRALRLNTKANE